MSAIQERDVECYHCHARVVVVKRTDWDFDWKCDNCKMGSGTISWAHANKPPHFETAAQTSLFDLTT